MCYLITLVAGGTNTNEIVQRLDVELAWGTLRVQPNEAILRRLPPGRTAYCTSGHCDCGTGVGSGNPTNIAARQMEQSGEVQRLRLTNWSESRISRHIEDEQRKADVLVEQELSKLVAFLQALISDKGVGCAGILIHFYDGMFDDEDFDFTSRLGLDPANLTAQALKELDEDFYLEFGSPSF